MNEEKELEVPVSETSVKKKRRQRGRRKKKNPQAKLVEEDLDTLISDLNLKEDKEANEAPKEESKNEVLKINVKLLRGDEEVCVSVRNVSFVKSVF